MNPRDFLDVASEWATGASEAEWRSAVSRAYYAAFHVARDLLIQAGFRLPGDTRDHAYLWLRLGNCGNVVVQDAGAQLRALRQVRAWVDYELDRPFPGHLAPVQVDEAIKVVQVLDALPGTPAVLSTVIDAIRTYERDVLREVTWRSS